MAPPSSGRSRSLLSSFPPLFLPSSPSPMTRLGGLRASAPVNRAATPVASLRPVRLRRPARPRGPGPPAAGAPAGREGGPAPTRPGTHPAQRSAIPVCGSDEPQGGRHVLGGTAGKASGEKSAVSCEDGRGAGVVQPREPRLGGYLIAPYNCLTGGCSELEPVSSTVPALREERFRY